MLRDILFALIEVSCADTTQVPVLFGTFGSDRGLPAESNFRKYAQLWAA
jgi:hypothetical protein